MLHFQHLFAKKIYSGKNGIKKKNIPFFDNETVNIKQYLSESFLPKTEDILYETNLEIPFNSDAVKFTGMKSLVLIFLRRPVIVMANKMALLRTSWAISDCFLKN